MLEERDSMYESIDRETRRAARKAPSLLIPIALLAVTSLLAQPGQPLNGFVRTGDYLIELDGSVVDEAKVYRSAVAQAVLVIAPNLEAPVLIRPRARSVEKVSLLKVSEKADGSIDLLPNPTYAAEPAFRVDGADVVLEVDGRDMRLKPKPALVGFHQPESIYQHSPEYQQRAGFYQPEVEIVEALRAQGKSVRVQIFFGTWCPACGQIVPGILKLAEQTRGSKIEFSFYGLARDFSDDTEAQRLGIKSVPTAVVWIDGKQLDEQVTGNAWRRPEATLHRLIGS